ncbi:hypothetical protein AB0K48_02140 [Nonomuraea sp. NPDC055795]
MARPLIVGAAFEDAVADPGPHSRKARNPRDEERVVGVIEPERQTVGVG